MKSLKINHGAVWASVVLSFVVGYLWYGPIFGDPWMEMVGLDLETIEANPPSAGDWTANIISSVVQMYMLAWLFTKMNIDNGMRGAFIGLLVGFAFNLMPGMTNVLFAQSPYGLAWIHGGFTIVILTIAGFVLGTWKKYSE